MRFKFQGSYKKLQKCVARTGLDGDWRELKHGQPQYRTYDRGILNWWQSTGTITFQGERSAAMELEQAFSAVASAKGLLQLKPRQTRTDLDEENSELRKLLSVIENRRLRARVSSARCG